MPGSYRPRPAETKQCAHCKMSFESRHKRTIYCGSSCRTLAYNLRHQVDQSVKAVKGQLSLSAQNVGVTAAGAAVAAVGNYVFNDRPAQREVMDTIAELKTSIEKNMSQILKVAQYQIDFIEAMKQVQPDLHFTLNQTRQQRKIEEVNRKREQAQELIRLVQNRKRR